MITNLSIYNIKRTFEFACYIGNLLNQEKVVQPPPPKSRLEGILMILILSVLLRKMCQQI